MRNKYKPLADKRRKMREFDGKVLKNNQGKVVYILKEFK